MAKNQKRKTESKHSLVQDPLWSDRKTLYTLGNKEGQVVELDPVNYGIRVAGVETVLFPVNLPSEFRHTGIKIRFSGQVKEIDLSELWAGQPVLLTEAEKVK